MKKPFALCVGMLVICGWIADSALAAVSVVPVATPVAGQSIQQWTTAWWNWALASGPGPVTDTTGALATANQTSPVFFVAGTPGGAAVSRTFTVPDNKFILVPLINWLVANGPDAPFATTLAEAKALGDSTLDPAKLFATVDGVNVAPLAYRVDTSANFNLTAVNGNDLGVPAGSYTDGASSGYWLMFAPLSDGPHTLHFGGTSNAFVVGGNTLFPSFTVDTTAGITVAAVAVPLPPAVWAGLTTAIPLLLLAARRRHFECQIR